MSCRLEPGIWSRDTGQQILCFDRCQLIITWMSNIKGVHGKPRLHVSVNPLLIWSMAAMLHAPPSPSSSSRVRAHEQYRCPWQPWENQVMGFFFPIWLWGSAWRPFGPPELRYNHISCRTPSAGWGGVRGLWEDEKKTPSNEPPWYRGKCLAKVYLTYYNELDALSLL